MSSPTKQFGELNIARSRRRADTTDLLPSSHGPSTTALPEAPVPELSTSFYTNDRLQRSLVYAEICLKRRDISPRSELFMQLCKEEVKDALKAETAAERESHARMIMTEEKLIQEQNFLRPLKSAEEAEMEDQMLQLREFQYYARYGNYMKIIPNRLRLKASNKKLENWQLISENHYWTSIAAKIEEEEKSRSEAVLKGIVQSLRQPTIAAVYGACTDLGISDKMAIWAIKEYGARNRGVHRDLNDYKKKGQFPLLASILWADRNELFSTFSSIRSETDLNHLQAIIQSEIDVCFEDAAKYPDHPDAWIPSLALRQIHDDAAHKAKQPSKEETKQSNIAKAQRKSEEKAARQTQATSSSAAGKKPIASTQEPRGSEHGQQKKSRQQRVKLMARRYRLEEELSRTNRDLALFDENEVTSDENDTDNDENL